MAFRVDLTAAAGRGWLRAPGRARRAADRHTAGRGRPPRAAARAPPPQPRGLRAAAAGHAHQQHRADDAGYTCATTPDASFGPFFKQQPQYARETDPSARRDGQWLADALGLGRRSGQPDPRRGRRDRIEARAMQIALWPATLGYMMETLLTPVFSDADVAATREFFTRYVSGRGPLPGAADRRPALRHPAGRGVRAARAGSASASGLRARAPGHRWPGWSVRSRRTGRRWSPA